MSRNLVPLCVSVLLAAGAVHAQDNSAQKQRPTNATASRPDEDRARPTPSTVNVEVELTITDSIGSATPQKKTISMLIADGQMGRIRSARGPANAAVLNVDATPVLMTNDRIRLQLILEYSPPSTSEQPSRLSGVNELATVLLPSGKPVTISHAADPANDRRVTVEVKATILK